mgnify:CR=1 FL=1
MSYNVWQDSIFPDADPQKVFRGYGSKADEFVRLVKAVAPDCLCLQEISPYHNPQKVGDILDGALPLADGERWRTHSASDNVIASRFDLLMCDEELIPVVHMGHAMALVDLPDVEHGDDLYLICAHLMGKGGKDNIAFRQHHADAIIRWIRDVKTLGGEINLPPDTPMIVLGDFNVYDTDPAYQLTTLLTGDIADEGTYGPDIPPDWDGTDLADALPRHNASGEDTYTWRDDTQPYNPGVLDRILYTDSVIRVDNAFVLNTTIMSESALDATVLEAGDEMLDPEMGNYDHLPLVVDVILRSAPDQR